MNVSLGAGLAIGAVVALLAPWQLAILIGWSAASGTLLVWVWAEIGRCDPVATRARSTAEDSSHLGSIVVMVVASVMSLAGVATGLAESRHVGLRMEVALTVAALAAVVLSWCVVHTMFTLHYAHHFYIDPVGGIELPGEPTPDYRDFAYFAFTIGMSFATSDADITSRAIRRIALRHALVSYLFGVVIIGLTINVMAGFI